LTDFKKNVIISYSRMGVIKIFRGVRKMNFGTYTVEDLKAVVESAKAELKIRREASLVAERNAKAEREVEFKGKVSEGDLISFRFNKEEREAKAVRVSEKSVTVEVDAKKKYIKYANILAIVEKAEDAKVEEVKAEEADTETEVEETEAVADEASEEVA